MYIEKGRFGTEVYNCFPGAVPEADTAWIGSNPVKDRVGIYKYKWVNPHPEKKIVSIDMKSSGKAVLVLVAITGRG